MKHLNEPLPDPRKEVPSIPEEVVDILERMTAKDPGQRYINCRELLWDLKSRNIDDSQDVSHVREEGKPAAAVSKSSKVNVDTSVFQGHNEMKKQFPALFTPNNIVGAMTITESGTLLNIQGKFPEDWKHALYILNESTIELNAAAQLGQWQFKMVETPEELLALFPEGNALGTLLVDQKDTHSFSSATLSGSTGSFVSVKHSQDPIQQVASIAGVTDVFLFDLGGQLVDFSLNDEKRLETYKQRFAPASKIIQSLAFKITSMDLWFEKGRILVYILEGGIIFVIGSLGMSRSFLSIYISAHLEQLKTNTQTAIVSPKGKNKLKTPAKSIPKEVDNPVPVALMEKVQLELARLIGPISKVVLSKECKKMGYSRSKFPDEKLLDLVKGAASRVDESKRQEFLDKVQDVIYDFRSNK
jgi:hypothetical protein